MFVRSHRVVPALCLSVAALFLGGCINGDRSYRYGDFGSGYDGCGREYGHVSGSDPVTALILLAIWGGTAIYEALSGRH